MLGIGLKWWRCGCEYWVAPGPPLKQKHIVLSLCPARLLLVLKREDEDGVANELLGHAEVELRTLLASQGQAQEHVLALLDRAGRKTGGRLRLVLRWHRAAATTSTAAAASRRY